MSDIIKTQRSLATKAQYQPAHQFDHLYRLICQQEWLRAALTRVLANAGARTAGVDGMTKEALLTESSQNAFVHEIEQELRERSFRPSPVRRVYIPKGTGHSGLPSIVRIHMRSPVSIRRVSETVSIWRGR